MSKTVGALWTSVPGTTVPRLQRSFTNRRAKHAVVLFARFAYVCFYFNLKSRNSFLKVQTSCKNGFRTSPPSQWRTFVGTRRLSIVTKRKYRRRSWRDRLVPNKRNVSSARARLGRRSGRNKVEPHRSGLIGVLDCWNQRKSRWNKTTNDIIKNTRLNSMFSEKTACLNV